MTCPAVARRIEPARGGRTLRGTSPGGGVPAIGVVTLGVADLGRSVRFYRDGLGLPLRAHPSGVVYLPLPGAWLALYPREALAAYAGASPQGGGFRGVALAFHRDDPAGVDALMAAAITAGGHELRAPGPVEWGGYTGWFADPDGHLFEVVYNPRPLAGDDDPPKSPAPEASSRGVADRR